MRRFYYYLDRHARDEDMRMSSANFYFASTNRAASLVRTVFAFDFASSNILLVFGNRFLSLWSNRSAHGDTLERTKRPTRMNKKP